jgi:outer membrane protein
MKQIAFIAIVWLACMPVAAQPTGGKFFVGGHFSLYGTVNKSKDGSTTEKDGSTTYFTFMPLAGYFLNDRVAVGAGLGFDTQIDKDPQSTIEKSTTSKMVFNPYARYYLISGTGGIFAEASMGFSVGTNKTFTNDVTDTENVFGFSALLSPGVYYYVTPRLALEAKFGWFGFMTNTTNTGNDHKDIQNSFGIDLSPDSFIFGLTFTL